MYRPQTQGEEELQLQLALAMSRQETNSYQPAYFLTPDNFYPLNPFFICTVDSELQRELAMSRQETNF